VELRPRCVRFVTQAGTPPPPADIKQSEYGRTISGVASLTMSARFVALEVSQGDAFLIERNGFRALVDGGRSKKTVELLKTVLTKPHLDVVVCTHNDSDHANGIRYVFESEELSIAEAWLPGRWADRLIDICRLEDDFFRELHDEVRKEAVERHARTVEELSERLPSGSGELERNRLDRSENELADSEDYELLDAIDGAHVELPWYWWWPRTEPGWSLWIDAIHAAERIRAIAVAARNAGCRIRWFDYALFQTGMPAKGGRAELLPINSIEVAVRPPRRTSPLSYLTLTVSNRESLVFRSPQDAAAPGVLFTADSDLTFGDRAIKIGSDDIISAPHRGSEHNATAYVVVDRLAANPSALRWVRSDCRFRGRPGQTYLAKQGQAMCTRCRGNSNPPQRVDLRGSGGTWTPRRSVRACLHVTDRTYVYDAYNHVIRKSRRLTFNDTETDAAQRRAVLLGY
jgi:metallo-beta-lactamase superfamily protein